MTLKTQDWLNYKFFMTTLITYVLNLGVTFLNLSIKNLPCDNKRQDLYVTKSNCGWKDGSVFSTDNCFRCKIYKPVVQKMEGKIANENLHTGLFCKSSLYEQRKFVWKCWIFVARDHLERFLMTQGRVSLTIMYSFVQYVTDKNKLTQDGLAASYWHWMVRELICYWWILW